MNNFSTPATVVLDTQTLHWEDHPVLRAVETGNVSALLRIFNCHQAAQFGRDRSNFIRNECGVTPLMLALSKGGSYPPGVLHKIVTILLDKFRLDPNMADYHGRTAILYAMMNKVDVSVILLLINRGADVKQLDHEQLSPLMYAAALARTDVVRFVCPDYRAQITATLKMRFASFDSGLYERQRGIAVQEQLEVPYRMEGSPKHYVPFMDSPITASPINGIRFRLSPSSPAASSNATSPLSLSMTAANYTHEPNVSRRTSLDKPDSYSGRSPTTAATATTCSTDVNVMRRISSAVFDSRLHRDNSGCLQFAQLTQNLTVYLEDVDNLIGRVNDEHNDKSPGGEDGELRDNFHSIAEALREEAADVLTAIDDTSDELEDQPPRRVSLPVSAPILIKSRSVEESINREQCAGGAGMDASFRAMPRDLRKNALASGHLIERQGSAPQLLLLKRKPRGSYGGGGGSGGGSAESSGAPTPTGSITRAATRLQILSPLVQSALSSHQQK